LTIVTVFVMVSCDSTVSHLTCPKSRYRVHIGRRFSSCTEEDVLILEMFEKFC